MKKALIIVLAALAFAVVSAGAALANNAEEWGYVYNHGGYSCHNCTAFGSPPSQSYYVNAGAYVFYPVPPVYFSVYAQEPTATRGCYYFSDYITKYITGGYYETDLTTYLYRCP